MAKNFMLFVTLNVVIAHSYAQDINSFTKVRIEYYRGGNSWVEPGVYSRQEVFEFVKSSKGDFTPATSLFIKYSLGRDSVTRFKDSLSIPFAKRKISVSYFYSLLKELNSTKDNYTTSFIKPFLKLPSKKKQILQIAAKIGDTLISDKFDREDRDTIYKRLRRFYLLDSFLTLHRPTMERMVTMDAYNGCRALFIGKGDTVMYSMDFLNFYGNDYHLGQPLERFHIPDYMHSGYIINLAVNAYFFTITSKKEPFVQSN